MQIGTTYRGRLLIYLATLMLMLTSFAMRPSNRHAVGQEAGQPPPGADDGGPSAIPQPPIDPSRPPAAATEPAPAPAASSDLNALNLFFEGGIFMYPIAALCFIGVTFAIERWIGLRRSRVIPDRLIDALGQLGAAKGGFDPRAAYRACQQYPSTASNVIRSMLQLVGRPRGEIEHVVKEVSEREAERLYKNVRWLNLCASVTPLIGLLGTIQGMIMAFHDTTLLPPGANKATELAHGIYVALVTTFGGLVVAIPATMLSHLFEGRIQTMFHELDELLFNLLPQVERFEGRVRFNRGPASDGDRETGAEPPPFKEPAAGSKG